MICISFVPTIFAITYYLTLTRICEILVFSKKLYNCVYGKFVFLFYQKSHYTFFFIDVKNYNVKQTHVFSLIEVKVVVRVK